LTEVEIVELEPIHIEKPLLFTGFTGPGLIGPTVVMYIIQELGAKQVAYVKSTLFPPITRVIRGVPQPPIRIYADYGKKMLFMISDTFIQNESANKISTKIFEWIKNKGINEIISINGMPFIGLQNIKHIIFGYSTGNSKYHSQPGIYPLNDGVISGMDSVLLHKCLESEIIWTSLMVTTRELTGLDPSAVIKALETVTQVFKLNVNTEKLKNEYQKLQPRKKEGFMDSLKKRF
jgi:predicted ATP-grasp superfamily ATP-dependent carboligase